MKLRALALLTIALSAGALFRSAYQHRAHETAAKPRRPVEPERLPRLVQRVREVERRSRALGSSWTEVRDGYLQSQRAFTAAEIAYQVAARSSDAASTTFTEARTAWEEARWRWKLYQQLVLVAAAIDAHNIDRFRELTGNRVDSLDCSAGMSRRTYRELLEDKGYSLTGKDIDHIVPLALGGAEHPANYQILDSSHNRSLQDAWGPGKCRLAGSKCAGAIAISRDCGTYRGPEF